MTRRFAIGDVHGCVSSLQALIETIHPDKNDKIFLLGDYINKGPSSKNVLDLVMKFIKEGYSFLPIRGNHDQKLLDVVKGNVPGLWQKERQLKHTLESFKVATPFEIPDLYLNFLNNLPFYQEEPDFLLVHAGFNFNIVNIFKDECAMLGIKRYTPEVSKLKGKRIIQGHIPVSTDVATEKVELKSTVLMIDTGCVYYEKQSMGMLTALDIDNEKLIFQKNIDAPYDYSYYK